MPTKSLLNTSGTYEIITNKTADTLKLTIILDKDWAKQLGLSTNKFSIQDRLADLDQQERLLEEKLWAAIQKTAQPIKATDYYYPEELFSKDDQRTP